jgi:hypothetical protein
MARVRVSARRSRRMQPPEHGVGAGIGLLALHAPVFELFEGNRAASASPAEGEFGSKRLSTKNLLVRSLERDPFRLNWIAL